MPMSPQQVAAFLEQVTGELEALQAAKTEVEQLQEEMRRMRLERDELAERLAAAADPAVAVGVEVENVLRATRQLADEVQERARRKAADLVAEAAEAAVAALAASQRLRTGAEMEAAEIISQAWRQSADLVVKQVAWYEDLLTAERAKGTDPEEGRPTPPLATDPSRSAHPPVPSPPAAAAQNDPVPAAPDPHPEPAAFRPLTSARRGR